MRKAVAKLAEMSLFGQGCEINEARALELFRQSAEQATRKRNSIWRSFMKPQGCRSDYQQAATWYFSGGRSGTCQGSISTGLVFQEGRGGTAELPPGCGTFLDVRPNKAILRRICLACLYHARGWCCRKNNQQAYCVEVR
jgi:TPR repeat protein